MRPVEDVLWAPAGVPWHLGIAVPKALRGQFKSSTGKPFWRIVKGLGRPAARALTEIEDAARGSYTATLARLAAEADDAP
jgi:hypothetical protein